MSEEDSGDKAQRGFALSVADSTERELIENFLRCERREGTEFLNSAVKAYRLRAEHHRLEADLYQNASEKLDRVLARLSGGGTAKRRARASSTGGQPIDVVPLPDPDASA